MLKSIMCVYLGVSFVWILGILKSEYWSITTQLNALFMLALGLGRLLSMLADGLPSSGYIAGTVIEIVAGLYAVVQLVKYDKQIGNVCLEASDGTVRLQRII